MRSSLAHPLSYFSPLWSGVVGGAFFTLQLAQTWNDLAARFGLRYLVAVVLAYGVAVGLLVAGFRDTLQLPAARHSVWEAVRRCAPLVAVCFTIALVESAGLIWLTEGNQSGQISSAAGVTSLSLQSVAGMRAIVLWTGVSMFGGIFIGLVSQGRSAVKG